LTDYQIIIERNLFNAHPLEKPPNSQNPPPSDAPPRQVMPLQLKLVGTITNTNGQPYALIEDLHQPGAQAVYQIGDTIQSALLADIHPTCVVLEQGGQEEWLCFQADEGMVKTTRSRPALPPAASHLTNDTGASMGQSGRES
jgi:type II secretory pathway component PulC